MKTIFRSFNLGLVLASIIALGAVAGLAQDPCTDVDGQNAMYDKFLAAYNVKTIEGRKQWVEIGKQYLEKYGSCTTNETVKTNSAYFTKQIPTWETKIKEMTEAAGKNALTSRFDKALTAKNWDETFASGKEILAKYPDDFRPVEITLAAIGGEEALKANNKYNDDALRLAKQSIADIEGGKSFKVGDKDRWGLGAGEFPNREDALAWLNLYTGYITGVGLKNKQGALPYLYKASQATTSDASKNQVVYDVIGGYYFDELNKLVEQIQVAAKGQSDTDTPEVAQQKVDAIKKLVAQSNGTAERAMDAYSRAFTFAKDPTVKARLKKNVEDAYKLRFGNTTGVDAWITSAVTKPFVNPATPIAPISDPEPVKTTTGETATVTPTPIKPVVTNTTTTTTVGKPVVQPTTKPVTPVTKPATKPVPKPKAAVKKTTKKKVV
jgi:hypothetical protein